MSMRVLHLLRKCDTAEWGGTEMAIQRLAEGLRVLDVTPVIYCPRVKKGSNAHALADTGCELKLFHTMVPVVGISRHLRDQMRSVGGNLVSFDLPLRLSREKDLSIIHTHTLGRLGGIAAREAARRSVPFVMSIHGGLLDVPSSLQASFQRLEPAGVDWGKAFGWFFQSRRLLEFTDAILTCNPTEAALLREQLPAKKVCVQPHGVPLAEYQVDHRASALDAFPLLRGKQVLLSVGRIDPVKNQRWLIEEAPQFLRKHPEAVLVLAGARTDEGYGIALENRLVHLGLSERVFLTGGLPPGDRRLIGLYQMARVVLLASISETFGLVILEAWAAGAPVIASRTSGASSLIVEQRNGWLFDLGHPADLHRALDVVLSQPELAKQFAAEGCRVVKEQFDSRVLASRVKDLYQQLIDAKHEMRNTSRRRYQCADAARAS